MAGLSETQASLIRIGHLVDRSALLEYMLRCTVEHLIGNPVAGPVVAAGESTDNLIRLSIAIIDEYLEVGDVSVGGAEQLQALRALLKGQRIASLIDDRNQVIHGLQVRIPRDSLTLGAERSSDLYLLRSRRRRPLMDQRKDIDVGGLIDRINDMVTDLSAALDACRGS